MVLAEPAERDKAYHRVVLTGVLANGEKLLHQIKRHEKVDPSNIGVQLEDVEATVGDLRLCYAEWFGDLKEERKKAIIHEVFGIKG